jgi:hypothetical protein
MEFYSPRTETVENIVTYLQTAVSVFALVKPYEGEFFKIWKRAQIQEDTFAAEVNLAAPFALVCSQERPVEKRDNRILTLKHDLAILIGVSNTHNFGSTEVPSVLALLEQCADALVGRKFHANASELNLENDGIFLVKTDLYIVYEQKYFQTERARK